MGVAEMAFIAARGGAQALHPDRPERPSVGRDDRRNLTLSDTAWPGGSIYSAKARSLSAAAWPFEGTGNRARGGPCGACPASAAPTTRMRGVVASLQFGGGRSLASVPLIAGLTGPAVAGVTGLIRRSSMSPSRQERTATPLAHAAPGRGTNADSRLR